MHMISFLPLVVVDFSNDTYVTYEGSRVLKLELVSSRKVEEANTLSIQLKDGSATCKLSIL